MGGCGVNWIFLSFLFLGGMSRFLVFSKGVTGFRPSSECERACACRRRAFGYLGAGAEVGGRCVERAAAAPARLGPPLPSLRHRITQKELTRTEDLRKMLKEFEETSDRDVAF